jgi:hypothetical protein
VFGPVVDGGNQIFPNGTSPAVDIGYNENADGWDVGYVAVVCSSRGNIVFRHRSLARARGDRW